MIPDKDKTLRTPLLHDVEGLCPKGFHFEEHVESRDTRLGVWSGPGYCKPGTLFKRSECIPHGKGRLTLPSGDIFETECKDGGLLSDIHTGGFSTPSGSVYEGVFKTVPTEKHGYCLVKHGRGSMTYPTPPDAHVLKKQTGFFVENHLHGKAVLEFQQGYVYEGNVIDGEPHDTEGVMTLPDRSVVKGVFRKGEPFTGPGARTFPSGLIYKGAFGLGGCMHGAGVLHFPDPAHPRNKHSYTGFFENGAPLTGEGTLSINNGDISYEGIFRCLSSGPLHTVFECTGKYTAGSFASEGRFRITLSWVDGAFSHQHQGFGSA
jgi:hypothetical protein